MPEGTCSISVCEKPRFRRDWCRTHYTRWSQHGDPYWEAPPPRRTCCCSVDDCEGKHEAKGLCASHYLAAYRVANKAKIAAQRRAYDAANLERTRERTRAWQQANPDRVRANRRRWAQANRDRLNAQWRAFAAANREKQAERHRAYYAKNRDASSARRKRGRTQESRERERVTHRAWREANADRVRVYSRKGTSARRARKRAAAIAGPVPLALYRRVLAAGSCAYCGGPAEHVDHIRPLSRGGIEHESNLVAACSDCNGNKNAKLLTEWDPARVARGARVSRKIRVEWERLRSGQESLF